MHLRHPSPPTALTMAALLMALLGVWGVLQLPMPHALWHERPTLRQTAPAKSPPRPASAAVVLPVRGRTA